MQHLCTLAGAEAVEDHRYRGDHKGKARVYEIAVPAPDMEQKAAARDSQGFAASRDEAQYNPAAVRFASMG